MRASQLEFDLVSPLLGDPPAVVRLHEEASALAKQSWEKHQAARLAVRLHHEDLIHGEITDELVQMRVLLGDRIWKKTRKLWERRAKKNPRALRKVLLSAKNFFNL